MNFFRGKKIAVELDPVHAPEPGAQESVAPAPSTPPASTGGTSFPIGTPPHNISPARKILLTGEHKGWAVRALSDLVHLEPGWNCLHEPDSNQARLILLTGAFDALIIDGKMTDTLEVVEAARELSPKTLRLVRYDVADRTALSRLAHPGLVLLGSHEGAGALAENLEKAWWLQTQMEPLPIKTMLSAIRKLPVIPKIYAEVSEELRSPTASMEVVGSLIAQDPVMVAKILQIANSALLGLPSPVSDPAQAVQFLGTDRTRTLILAASLFSQFDVASDPEFSAEMLWAHSLRVGLLARAIVLAETRDAVYAQMAFTAGLLHEIGKLVMAANRPEVFKKNTPTTTPPSAPPTATEMSFTEANFARLGACMLGTWGFPLESLKAIAWHLSPDQSGELGFSLLTAVHVANVFTQKLNRNPNDPTTPPSVDLTYLTRIGYEERLEFWRKVCNLPDSSS